MDARLHNHCCPVKVINIAYSECVLIVVVIQYAKCMGHIFIVICDPFDCTIFFHIMSQRYDLGGKKLKNTKHVFFISSTTFV